MPSMISGVFGSIVLLAAGLIFTYIVRYHILYFRDDRGIIAATGAVLRILSFVIPAVSFYLPLPFTLQLLFLIAGPTFFVVGSCAIAGSPYVRSWVQVLAREHLAGSEGMLDTELVDLITREVPTLQRHEVAVEVARMVDRRIRRTKE